MTEVTVPFWTTTLVAQDQAGTTVSEAIMRVHKWERESLTSGTVIESPEVGGSGNVNGG